jgi:hypothetical protein
MVKTTNGHPSIHPFFHVFDALRQDLQGRSLLQGTGARPWAGRCAGFHRNPGG